MLYARKLTELLLNRARRHLPRRSIRERGRSQRQQAYEYAIDIESPFGMSKIDERPHEKRRANEQSTGKGDLAHQQHPGDRTRAMAFRAAPLGQAQRGLGLRAGPNPRRQEAGRQSRKDAGRGRHGESACIDVQRVQRAQEKRLGQERP